MDELEKWLKNTEFQYSRMETRLEDGDLYGASRQFDEYTYSLGKLNDLGGSFELPSTPDWYQSGWYNPNE